MSVRFKSQVAITYFYTATIEWYGDAPTDNIGEYSVKCTDFTNTVKSVDFSVEVQEVDFTVEAKRIDFSTDVNFITHSQESN